MTNTGLHRYALSLLKKYDCERDAYQTDCSGAEFDELIANSIHDLEVDEEYGAALDDILHHKKYTAEDILRELYAIGNASKRKRSKYSVYWDNGDCSDAHEAGNNLQGAKDAVFETLVGWMTEFGEGIGNETPEDWDYMIYNCWATVHLTSDEDTPDEDHSPVWGPSHRELKKIGWVTTDEMDDVTYNQYRHLYKWPRRKKQK